MIKNSYFIRHVLPTNASITDNKQLLVIGNKPGWGFKLGENELCLHDSEEGFIIDAIIHALNLEEAKKEAKAISENLGHCIVFTSGEVVSSAIFQFGYDFSQDIKEREFQQIIISPISNNRHFNPLKSDEFSEVFEVINSTVHNPEIMRALMFLRTASQDNQNEIIKFTNLWQGLEVLNDKLIKEFPVPEKEIWNICGCGRKISPKTSLGIQIFFNNDNEFHEIRTLRGKIIHGDTKFDYNLVDKCERKNKILKIKLIEAITLLLKLPETSRQRLSEMKRRPLNPSIKHVIKAKLVNFNPTPLININQHKFLKITESTFNSDSCDNKHGEFKNTFYVINGTFQDFVNMEYFIRSYDESENVIKDIETKID